jgi:hypothetical protein
MATGVERMGNAHFSREEAMEDSWKDSIHRQRVELAGMLREPLERLAQRCVPAWGDREGLNAVLRDGVWRIPYCASLYALDGHGVQISDNVSRSGPLPGHFGRDRRDRPYMQEPVPPWGFLLSDAYISLHKQRPSLTALQEVRDEAGALGYLGADFDLRNLPVTSELYEEPREWLQVKGDPAIRGTLFQQTRVESPMDRDMDRALSVLEELVTERGVFQCQIHFSSSQATIWVGEDPFRYRILNHEAMTDPDICLVYRVRPYPDNALIAKPAIGAILATFKALRAADDTVYLRTGSINIFNGMVSVTFSCDGSHYMRYEEFLGKNVAFWFGTAA